MPFDLGQIVFDVTGDDPTGRRFRPLLESLQTAVPPDLVFRFVDDLPLPRADAACGPYHLLPDRLVVRDRVWRFDLAPGDGGKGLQVTLCRAPQRLRKRVSTGLSKGWRHLLVHGRGAYIFPLKRFVYYVYLPAVELALLGGGASLAHCSAVERDGRVVAFAASGGVGKTSLMTLLVDEGWRFLADDFSVIAADGTCHLHPLPMHIYKFHEKHCPTLVERMLRQARPWDRFLWRALGAIRAPDKLVRWVRPDEVLGADRLARRGRLAAMIFLRRDLRLQEPQLAPASAAEMAGLMTHVLLSEIPFLSESGLAVSAFYPRHPVIRGLDQTLAAIRGVFESALAGCDCRILSAAADTTPRQIAQFLKDRRVLPQDGT
jgi:hypothetical protein